MASQSRIVELSQVIATNTEAFGQWLRDNDLEQPSFDASAAVLPEHFPPEIGAAKLAIESACIELKELIEGPRKIIHNALLNHHHATETIYETRLVHLVPLDKPEGISYQKLSEETGIAEFALQKIIRYAISCRLFTEPTLGMVAHSAASKLWATDPSMDDYAAYFLADAVKTFMYVWPALKQFPAANEPTQTALSVKEATLRGGKFDTMYNIFAKNPERGRSFASVMNTYQRGDGYSLRHAVEGYDWSALQDGSTVVDVGGSHGELVTAVASKFPKLRYIVQDLPGTIATAPAVKHGVPIKFMGHDFFEPQPVKGAKVYFFRWIFHNWPEKYCLRILQALIPALEQGSRVVIMDAVVPPMGQLPNSVEREVRWMDLSMMALFNAADRPAEQWEDLFAKSDSRFEYKGVKSIEGSILSLVEAVWKP